MRESTLYMDHIFFFQFRIYCVLVFFFLNCFLNLFFKIEIKKKMHSWIFSWGMRNLSCIGYIHVHDFNSFCCSWVETNYIILMIFFLNEWVFRTSFCSLGQILIQFLSQPKMRISDKRHSLFIHILLEHNLFFFLN